MSMQGDAGASAAAAEVIRFIEGEELATRLGRPLTDEDRKLLAPVLRRLREIKEAADSGWF